ncbi:MOSC domain-containing protein [Spirochaetota bacterium]
MKVVSVNISLKKGTTKNPVGEIIINEDGVEGDAHAGTANRKVSLLSKEKIDYFSSNTGSRKFDPGDFAENITFSGLEESKILISDRFKIGDVELEVTQLGKECHGNKCAIFTEVGSCVMPKEGIFCRVINGGKVKPGDDIEYISGSLKQ